MTPAISLLRYQFSLFLVCMAAGLAGPPQLFATTVTVSGRQLFVDGQPFFMKGVGYSPAPIGADPSAVAVADYFTSNWSALHQRDLPVLRALGANAIRLWNWDRTADHSAFLNAAYNNGAAPIYVVVPFFMSPDNYPDISSSGARAQIKADFRAMVAAHKNSPAVLMWAIGNESNADWVYGNRLSDLFSLINEMAQEAHLEEGANFHPVTSPLADINTIPLIAAHNSSMTNLDIWSANVYRGLSFGNFFSAYASASSKPLVILEYGIDAYDDVHGSEYEATQALYAKTLFEEMAAYATISSGGSLMEYNDEWWKGKFGQVRAGCPDMDPAFHGICGFANGSHPDGYSNEEWWGVMRSVDNGSMPDIMQPRAVYYALQSIWSPERKRRAQTLSQ